MVVPWPQLEEELRASRTDAERLARELSKERSNVGALRTELDGKTQGLMAAEALATDRATSIGNLSEQLEHCRR